MVKSSQAAAPASTSTASLSNADSAFGDCIRRYARRTAFDWNQAKGQDAKTESCLSRISGQDDAVSATDWVRSGGE